MTDGTFLAIQLISTYALDFIMRRFQVGAGNQRDTQFVPLFQVEKNVAFLVEQVSADIDGDTCQDAPGFFLHGIFFDDAKDRQRQGFHAAHGALTATARAYDLAGFTQ